MYRFRIVEGTNILPARDLEINSEAARARTLERRATQRPWPGALAYAGPQVSTAP